METVAFESVKVDREGNVTERASGQATIWKQALPGRCSLEWIAISGGMFRMGSPYSANPEERPQRPVTVASFWMSRGLVTQAQWQALMGKHVICRFQGPDLPVENVTWNQARNFCRRLSQIIGKDCRLPSEAQWEYACRAGTVTPFSTGETITTDLANYVGEHIYANEPKGVYRHTTTPAGTFPPNPLGVFDMHGNLWEFCADRWHPDFTGAPYDSHPWDYGGESGFRVSRGGSWHETPGNCRSTVRLRVAEDEHEDYYGFRMVMLEGTDEIPGDRT